MKKIILLLGLIFIAQSAFAEVYENNQYQTERTYQETYRNDTQSSAPSSQEKAETKYEKKIKFNNSGSSYAQTYWNFGKPNFGGRSFYH